MEILGLLTTYPMFTVAVFAILGALSYRIRGLDKSNFPSFLQKSFIWRFTSVLLPALGIFVATQSYWAFLAIPFMWYGVIVGHGSYFSRSDGSSNEDNENFKFITRLISDPLDQKGRFVGMALTGLAMTLPVLLIPVIAAQFGAALFVIGYWYGLVGILKAVVYFTAPDTEYSEWIWGGVYTGLSPLVFFNFGL